MEKFNADIKAIHESFDSIMAGLDEEKRKNAVLVAALLEIIEAPLDSVDIKLVAIKALTTSYGTAKFN